jgi:hypothetical protein
VADRAIVRENGAAYRKLVDANGKEMEAVYRVQESQSTKDCESEDCALNGRILPTQRYARVFYRDTNVVEIFHFACFQREFGHDHRH